MFILDVRDEVCMLHAYVVNKQEMRAFTDFCHAKGKAQCGS